jgi:mRNA interferase RelE/StbE
VTSPQPPQVWTVDLTGAARDALKQITDARVQQGLKTAILGLAHHPDQQGKALTGDLKGLRSLRAMGQRYRILYTLQVDHLKATVVLVGIRKAGDRKDVYAIAKQLAKRGLLT